jgi:hypothetical protein
MIHKRPTFPSNLRLNFQNTGVTQRGRNSKYPLLIVLFFNFTSISKEIENRQIRHDAEMPVLNKLVNKGLFILDIRYSGQKTTKNAVTKK